METTRKEAARDPADRVESALHDAANALAAARSYGESVRRRSEMDEDLEDIAHRVIGEIDRASEIIRAVRRATFQKGDVLHCLRCSHTFVHSRARGTGNCRRCASPDLVRLRP